MEEGAFLFSQLTLFIKPDRCSSQVLAECSAQTVSSCDGVVLLQQQTVDSVQDFSLVGHLLQQLPLRWAEVGRFHHLKEHV